MNEEIYALYSEFLPDIDQMFAKKRVPIQHRPLQATIFICEHYLVSIDGEKVGNLTDYFSKIWFGVFLKVVEKWYKNKYGDTYNNEEKLRGLVFLFNSPFLLSIPKTIKYVSKEEETFSVRFLDTVLDEESPLEWISQEVDIDSLNNVKKTKTIENIKNVAALTRSINMNLMADFPTKESQKMLMSVFTHINNGINNIFYGWNDEETIYIWEFHLAVEKSMKVYLQQKNIKYKRTHSLKDLNSTEKELISPKLLMKLPHHSEAISYRYNEGKPLDEKATMELYLNTLEAVNSCMSKYKRKFNMSKATVVFRRPSWVDIEA